jgi:allantoicase
MADGWENARRRDGGNDYVEFQLAAPGVLRLAEIDTSCFIGNAPGWVSLAGRDARANGEWHVVLPKTRAQPDTPHRFLIEGGQEMTHVRLDIYPDGGVARVRLHGNLGAGVRDALTLRWFNALPDQHASEVLKAAGVRSSETIMSARPLPDAAALPSELLP